MARCECGRELALASVQPHQKNSAIFVAVCSKSLRPPPDCTEENVVILRKATASPPSYGVFVLDSLAGEVIIIGAVVLIDGRWTWSLEEHGVIEEASSRDNAVRSILRNTTK